MTRPAIVRADSIDLQDQAAPSAKDHTRQPTQPSPLGAGPPAPHQAETLREVAAESADQLSRSPRVSKEWTNGEIQQLQDYNDELARGVTAGLNGLEKQDTVAAAHNGENSGSAGEDADGEGDNDMDDDMLDKISSSPSIDDGGYFISQISPQRSGSPELSLGSSSFSQACSESSSPFVKTPEHYPLRTLRNAVDVTPTSPLQEHHHLPGEYLQNERYRVNYNEFELGSATVHEAKLTICIDKSNQAYDLDAFIEEILGESSDSRRHLTFSEDGEASIPYEDSDGEDDDDFDLSYRANSRFVDSGWGGECLQESEDIDFEFVYALHTFVATVEGQANATKGDTMVLLDDSNSYWWLVRVVKDSSIGYLPAEHIETPTERLARLNKHRNIDLTSTMLGDQESKSKNPLKKAMRRRNAKTVTFTAPTYVEASDIDYSTEEDDSDADFYGQNGQQDSNGDRQTTAASEDEIAPIEPLKTRADTRDGTTLEDTAEANSVHARASDDIADDRQENNKSRNGTVRNTDSFFKDDSVETKKISLTPNLLRDDSSGSTRNSNESKELKQRPSLDKLEKDPPVDKKEKKASKDKKEKDKKSGMLSGLFKRKDKKSRSPDDEDDDILMGKGSSEADRLSPVPSKDSEELVAQEKGPPQEIQRQPSKLQKQPPSADAAALRKPNSTNEAKPVESQQAQAPHQAPHTEVAQAPTMRLVQADPAEPAETLEQIIRPATSQEHGLPSAVNNPKEHKTSGSISNIFRSASLSNADSKPVKAKKAKSRVELDDFDSSEDELHAEEPVQASSSQTQRPIPGSFPDSYIGTPQNERSNAMEERLSESPVQVSPITPPHSTAPPLLMDSSSQEEPPSPISSPSPELIDPDDAREKKGSSTTSTSTTAWSDAHLRTFFDDDMDVKDLLAVVYDKSGVVPAGPTHPITGNLFMEENSKLADITNRLDSMLGDWLARKMRTQGSR